MIEGLWLELAAMFGIGLLGSGHCLGMCGGIASALSFASDKKPSTLLAVYNFGRIASYAVAGGLVASVGYLGSSYLALGPVLRGVAGVLLISMGFYLGGWWRGLSYLEKGAGILWRYLQPLGQALLPVRSGRSAMVFGMVWGWLPCGLVYTALAFSATAKTPLSGALQMLAFGLGTTPAVLLGGLSMGKFAQFLRTKQMRRVFAIMFIVYGLWTLIPAQILTSHQYH